MASRWPSPDGLANAMQVAMKLFDEYPEVFGSPSDAYRMVVEPCMEEVDAEDYLSLAACAEGRAERLLLEVEKLKSP